MEGIITYQSYSEYKADLDKEFQETAEDFVRIGYKLKYARDTDILKESGYSNLNEFAYAEYNIDKTVVSRFIRINDRFSEGGNSPQLKEQYRNFGYAKLGIMLQLPDSINEELSPVFSKSEIQAVKEEYDAEMKKTDLEVLMEEKPEGQQDMGDNLSKAVWQLGRDEPELYKGIYDAVVKAEGGYKALQEAIAPAGEGIYSVRIPGTGRLLLSVKETGHVTLTNIRTEEKEEYTWETLYRTVCGIVRLDSGSPEESWEKVYGEPFPVKEEPEKPEVAPVQQKKKEDKKPVQKKKSKVTKAKTEEKPVNTQSEEENQKPEEIAEETETSSPGRTPETESTENETKTIENVTEIAEIVTETPMDVTEQGKRVREEASLKPHMTLEKFQIRRQEYVDDIMSVITEAKEYMENGSFLMAKAEMEKGIDLINKMFKLEQENVQYMVELEKKKEDEVDKEDDEDADE